MDTLKRDTGATGAKELVSLMEEEVDPRKKEEISNWGIAIKIPKGAEVCEEMILYNS